MPIENPPAFVQSGSYTARSDRLHAISARFMPSLTTDFSLGARGGLLSNGTRDASYIISGGTGWGLVVGPFTYVVENDFAANGGDYLVVKNGNDNLTLTPASSTTSRVDTIAVQVVDAFYSGSVTEGRLVVIEGTPSAGTPTAPALPPSCEPIFDAVVNAGSTSPVLVDRRRRTAMLNGITAIFGTQYNDLGRYAGETQYYDVLGTFRVWRGGSTNAWRAFGGMLARSGAILNTTWNLAAGQSGNVSQVSLSDPGGIWAAQAAWQWELAWAGNDSRIDSNFSLDGMSNIVSTAFTVPGGSPFPPTHTQAGGRISGPLTGSRTVWFNNVKLWGTTGSVNITPFNYNANAVQILLRAT